MRELTDICGDAGIGGFSHYKSMTTPDKKIQENFDKKSSSIEKLNTWNLTIQFYEVIRNHKLDYKTELNFLWDLYKLIETMKTCSDWDLETALKLTGKDYNRMAEIPIVYSKDIDISKNPLF